MKPEPGDYVNTPDGNGLVLTVEHDERWIESLGERGETRIDMVVLDTTVYCVRTFEGCEYYQIEEIRPIT